MLTLALEVPSSITEVFTEGNAPSSTLATVAKLVTLSSGIFVDHLLRGLQVIAHDHQAVHLGAMA